MPHDSKGNAISVGDKVTMEFEVRELTQNEKDCNVTLVSVDTPAYSESHASPSNVVVTTNTKITTKAVLVALCLILSSVCCVSSCEAACGRAGGRLALRAAGLALRPFARVRERRAERVEARASARAAFGCN